MNFSDFSKNNIYKLLFYSTLALLCFYFFVETYQYNAVSATKYNNIFHALLDIRATMEKDIINNHPVDAINIKNKIEHLENVSEVHISPAGEMIVRMDQINQLIVMVPKINGLSITWMCYAAPHKDFCINIPRQQ